MKKILVLIGILVSSFVYSQSDTDSTTYPHNWSTKTSVLSDDYFLIFDASDNNKTITGAYLTPWYLSGNYFTPRSTSYKIGIGTTSTSFSELLYVNGTGQFTGNLTIPRLNLGSNYITYSSNDLIFYDGTNGAKTMTELLAAGSSSYTASNGISIVDDVIQPYGTISSPVDLQLTSSYEISSTDNSLRFILNGVSKSCYMYSNLFSVTNSNLISFTVTGNQLFYMDTDNTRIYDYKATKTGLQYGSNYTFDRTDNTLIPSMGAVRLEIEAALDTITTGGLGGTYDPDLSASSYYLPAYSSEDTTKWKYFTVVAGNTAIPYDTTVSITSSDFLNGNTVVLKQGDGSKTTITPIKIVVFYDYGTTTYVSDDPDYSAKFYLGATEIAVLYDDGIEATTDKIIFCTMGGDNYVCNPNADVTVNFNLHTVGNGTAKIKLYYIITDFN